MIVYLIKNKVNGKCYVGKTSRGLEKRWSEHVFSALENKDKFILCSAIRKYGPEGFELSILQECCDENELSIAEIFWIEKLKTFDEGYNMTVGGDGIRGFKHTEETKKKMSEDRKGSKNCNWGKKFSQETCLKISKNKMGTGVGPRPHTHGWQHSEDAKRKIGLASSILKRKSVACYSKNGDLLQIFSSLIEAAKFVGGSAGKISEVLCGHRITHKGYIWKYVINKQTGEIPEDGN